MKLEFSSVVREHEAARLLGVSAAALRRWRRERRGPAFVRIERCIGYRVTDLEQFLAANTCSNVPRTGSVRTKGRSEPESRLARKNPDGCTS